MSIISQATISNILPPPGLQEATKNSTSAWQENLEDLFRNAKDRFPDVVWEVGGVDDAIKEVAVEGVQVDEVWGHKAIVYARAPPSFQTRYFSFRQPLATFPVGGDYPDESESIHPHIRTPSPSPSTTTTTTTAIASTSLLRLTSSINSTLFSNELEYLYTGKGFGEAFEFLFDSSEPDHHHHHARGLENGEEDPEDPEALRIDKLRKDLVFMWRSRLYSDVRIALTGNFSSSSTPSHDNTTTAIFSSHRFILVSRSPYFQDALLSWPSKVQQQGSEQPTLILPSPPFTPASLHFTLGFIYTGTLIFSHRSYDLATAFAILRAALYLSLPTLHDEIQARIVQEMLHGLFHAFISFDEYERLTGGKWGTGGCRCRQCARRVPRVLEFAIADDVANRQLERGARRALVGLFGEGWVHQEFASLPLKIRESILKGLSKRTTPLNLFPLLFAAEHALGKLGVVIEPWGDISREMVMTARRTMDEVLCKESEACFNSDEWMELVEADGVRFEDGEKVEWAMAAVLRGVKDAYAASLYQTLVSAILLRPHPTDVNAPLLPATSHVRVQVEQTRLELLKWIGKRWLAIRQERGFDPLEGWALKEISDHIEVPIDDLLNPPHQTAHSKHLPKRQQQGTTSLLRPTSHHPHTSKVDVESDMASSMRVSLLSRSLPTRQNSTTTTTTSSTTTRDNGSSASSVRSAVRSSADSFASALSGNTVGATATRHSRTNGGGGGMSPAKRIVRDTRAAAAAGGGGRTVEMKDRPDSKLTPSVVSSFRSRTPSPSLMQPSILEPDLLEEGEEDAEGEGEADERDELEEEIEEEEYEDSRNGDMEDDSQSSIQEQEQEQRPPIKKILITRASLASVTSRSTTTTTLSSISSMRPKSSTSSIRSQSTLRKSVGSSPPSRRSTMAATKSTTTTPTATVSRTRSVPAPPAIRPTSSLSSVTDSTATFRTASSGGGGLRTSPITRTRRTSATSIRDHNKTKPSSPDQRTRRVSATSVSSVTPSVRSGGVRTMSTGKRGTSTVPAVPVVDPKKLGVAVGSRPGSIHSSVSGGSGSTASNSTSRKMVRKVVLKKTSSSGGGSGSGDADRPTEAGEAPPSPVVVKESEVGVKEEVEKEKEMNVVVEEEKNEVVKEEEEKEEEKPSVDEDMVLEDLALPNTASTITIKPKDRPCVDPIPASSEHKKSSSSASTTSVVTLKRKGSSDTIKTVKSSPPAAPAPIVVDVPLIKQLPPTPLSHPSSPHLLSQSSVLKQPSTTQTSTSTPIVPQGATLDIGIPCIIASKRKRFKAYARYIGEVEGEIGAWVGVEVPMPFGDSFWTTTTTTTTTSGDGMDKMYGDDRQWHDGTWGGVRYFEIGGMGGSEWDYGANEDRASRRRRVDGGSGISGGGSTTTTTWDGGASKGVLKREGDQLSIASASEMRRKKFRSVSPAVSDMSGVESRGLFVRPQQVLYVVDAVGADL